MNTDSYYAGIKFNPVWSKIEALKDINQREYQDEYLIRNNIIVNSINALVAQREKHQINIILTGFAHGVSYFMQDSAQEKQMAYLSPLISKSTLLHSESSRSFYDDYIAPLAKFPAYQALFSYLISIEDISYLHLTAPYQHSFHKINSAEYELIALINWLFSYPEYTLEQLNPNQSSCGLESNFFNYLILDNHILDSVEHIVKGLPDINLLNNLGVTEIIVGIENSSDIVLSSLNDLTEVQSEKVNDLDPRLGQYLKNNQYSYDEIVFKPGLFTLIEKLKSYQQAGISIVVDQLE